MDHDYEVRLGFYIRQLSKMCWFTQDELAVQLQLKGCAITRSVLAKIKFCQRHLYPDEIRHLHEILDSEHDEFFAN